MVVDTPTSQHLNHVLSQFDILEENVTSIDHIANERTSSGGMEALYMVMPTSENIERIIRDFTQDPPIYAAGHLFFIDGLSDRLFNRLTSSPIMPLLRQCVDLYTDFRAPESNVFQLQMPDAIYDIFNPRGREDLDRVIDKISSGLVSVCASLNEYPVIRYRRSLDAHHAAKSFPQRLAGSVQRALDDYAKSNPDFGQQAGSSSLTSRPRSVLFIADRSLDICAPLVHEFTYQAMANDLLPIQGDKYRYTVEGQANTPREERVATLSEEKDKVWVQVRHMHMREAIDKLMQDFNKFIGENSNFTDQEKASSLNDMKDMLASLPQFQEMKEQFGLHLSMAQECMNLFEKKRLAETAMVEQDSSTGSTPEGKFPKNIAVDLIALLANPVVKKEDRARLIILYIIFKHGLRPDDRKKLMRHAGLDRPGEQIDWEESILNLEILGVRVERGPGSRIPPRKKGRTTYVSNETDYDVSRFHPTIKGIVEDHLQANLSLDSWPYLLEEEMETLPDSQKNLVGHHSRPDLHHHSTTSAVPPGTSSGSLRSARPNWHRSRTTTANTPSTSSNRQRLIIFIAGGITYSEMRSAYEISAAHQKEVIIGGTSILKPNEFLQDLSDLAKGKPSRSTRGEVNDTGLVKIQKGPGPARPAQVGPVQTGQSHAQARGLGQGQG